LKSRTLLIGCIIVAIALFIIGVLLTGFDLLTLGYLGIFSLMIIIFPYSIIV